MTIAALITEGIGTGGSIKYAMTGGLDISATIPSIWNPVSAISATWTPTSDASGIWTPQTPSSNIWTPQ